MGRGEGLEPRRRLQRHYREGGGLHQTQPASQSVWLTRWSVPQLDEDGRFPAKTMHTLPTLPASPEYYGTAAFSETMPGSRRLHAHRRGHVGSYTHGGSATHRAHVGPPSPPAGARTARDGGLGANKSPRKSFRAPGAKEAPEPDFVASEASRTTGWVNSKVWDQEELEGQAWLRPLDHVPKRYLSQVWRPPVAPLATACFDLGTQEARLTCDAVGGDVGPIPREVQEPRPAMVTARPRGQPY